MIGPHLPSSNTPFAALAALILLVAAPTAFVVRQRFHFLSWHLADTKLDLQMVLDNMIEGVVIIDRERNIILMNRLGSQFISIDEEPASYRLIEKQYDAFTSNGVLLPFDQWPSSRALRGDFVQNYKVRHRRKASGEMLSRIISTAPAPGPRGKAGQVIISYRDDTERHRVDEARTRLAAIVESSDDAIIGTDDAGLVTSWNKGAEKISGYTASEMIGQSVTHLLPSGDRKAAVEMLERALRGETIEHFDASSTTHDNRHIRVDISISPTRNSSGEIIGASIIGRDITQTRNLERQLQQAQKMEAIGRLTGGIAHDFNNLLGIVSGNLDLLEGLLVGDEPALQRTQAAQKAAARCADLTRRLLAFSSKENLIPVATPLEHSVHNALEIAIHALGPEIDISTNLATSLPPVFIDPAGLESALLNLMVNARDAMPNGGALKIATRPVLIDPTHPYVANGRLKTGSYALVSVSDNGHGMSKETLERVFEPFFTTKERGRGTGLGLAMVYGFARQSKGHVQLYSEPGHGTTVSLYLPFADGGAPTLFDPPTIQKPGRKGGKILLVDDEPDLLEIGSAFLKKLGYQTFTARDAAQALRLIEETPGIDIIATDIIMPGEANGVELVQRVLELRPNIRIIYTSGFPADALARKNFAVEDHILLNKPYRLIELATAIANAMHEEPNHPPQPSTELSS